MRRLLSALVIVLFATLPAHAETVEFSYQAVMHIHATHAATVLDDENHVVGIGEFRGIAIFDDGEITVHRYDGWFDLTDGSGKFHGYALWRFEDGSEIRASYDGAARKFGDNFIGVEAKFQDFSGSGRFAGVSGVGEFAGQRLEPIDKGGSTYLRGDLTLTLPD